MGNLAHVRHVKLGVDYDTSWARRGPARFVRRLMVDGITRPTVAFLASPHISGLDRLDDLDGPAIFVANHSSHLDTSLMLAALPDRIRRHTAVAAGADYFFDKLWKAALWSLWINVIPVERDKVNRQTLDIAAGVLQDGWHLVVFPEGTRGEDDFVAPFRAGAAYLGIRCDVLVVPVYLEGTRRVFTPYTHRLRRDVTQVTFGKPVHPLPKEKTRDFNIRLERAVAEVADEQRTDWWGARRRAVDGTTPSLASPDGVDGWRRSWSGTERRARRTRRGWPLT